MKRPTLQHITTYWWFIGISHLIGWSLMLSGRLQFIHTHTHWTAGQMKNAFPLRGNSYNSLSLKVLPVYFLWFAVSPVYQLCSVMPTCLVGFFFFNGHLSHFVRMLAKHYNERNSPVFLNSFYSKVWFWSCHFSCYVGFFMLQHHILAGNCLMLWELFFCCPLLFLEN